MNTPPKLTDEQIDERPVIRSGYGYKDFARAIEALRDQQWLDWLAAAPGVERIMELADECAKAFKAADTIHGLHFYMGKQNALRTAVEQALAERVPATGKPYEKGRGNWEFAREGKDCIVVTTPGGGLTRLFRDGGGSMESLAYRMASMLAAAPQPPQQPAESPPECKTEAERKAFAFGWFKALESQRSKPASPDLRKAAQKALDAWQESSRTQQPTTAQYIAWHDLRAALEQPAEWVGLTDEELHEHCLYDEDYRFARAIEAKLREKNGGGKC